ncbi:MAG: M4 family metallopeptidase [Bacteroidota bacterium]
MKFSLRFWVFFAVMGSLFSLNGQNISPLLSQIATSESSSGWIFIKPEVNLKSQDLITTYKAALGLSQYDEFLLVRSETDELGFRHDRYQLFHQGIKVEYGELIIHSQYNRVVKANGEWLSILGVNTHATITPEEAFQAAIQHLGALDYSWNYPHMEILVKQITKDPAATLYPTPELMVTDSDFKFDDYKPTLAYKLDVHSMSPVEKKEVYVDAQTGKVLKVLDDLHTHDKHSHDNVEGTANTLYRGVQTITTSNIPDGDGFRLQETNRGLGTDIATLDMRYGTDPNVAVDFTDDDNIWSDFLIRADRAATDAHFMAEFTHDYFLNTFQRSSYDGNEMGILSYMHYSDPNYFNAFYNGLFMAFGDGGNGKPLSTPDIFAHEFTHGVTDFSANLIYAYESGALNESFSDIFGNVVEYMVDPGQADWKMGEDTRTIRNMQFPNEHNDPMYYLGRFWHTEEWDNGGVHINSGVQNRWFYLITEGGQGTDEKGRFYDLKGMGMEKAAAIAYRSLTVYLTGISTYPDARKAAIQAAGDLFGPCSEEFITVVNAWHAVGVGSPSVSNDFEVVGFGELDICALENTPLTIRVKYTGCDTFPGGNMDLAFNVPLPSQTVNEPFQVGELLPQQEFEYTFNQQLTFPETGTISIRAQVKRPGDPVPANNSLTTEETKTVGLSGNEFFPFNGRSYTGTYADTLVTEVADQADITVLRIEGREGRSMVIEGGSRSGFIVSDDFDVFDINDNYQTSICMCVDAANDAKLNLYFDRKQTYSPLLQDEFGIDPQKAAAYVNNLRVLVNDQEMARYNPATNNSDPFVTEQIDLSAFTGQQLKICFETVTHQSQANDSSNVGDRVMLDNIRFENIVNNPNQGVATELQAWTYPNPTIESLKIGFENVNGSEVDLSIFDLAGRRVGQMTVEAQPGVNGIKLDISNLPAGIYLVRISDGTTEVVRKVVKQGLGE